MNQDESIALWRQGKEVWNAWAEDMLRQKAELEKAGVWNGDKSSEQKWNEGARTDLSGLRFMTRALADAAEKQVGQEEESSRRTDADVKTLIIEGNDIDFSGFVFPWVASFMLAQFHGQATFDNAQFHEQASFGSAQFHGRRANFENAQFHGWASFGAAQFHGWEASFNNAQFHGRSAWFGGAQFHGHATFDSAQFHGQVGFDRAQFFAEASFQEAKFQRQARFVSASFEKSVSFLGTAFGSKEKPQHANFTAIKSDRAFDLTDAKFSKVPSFCQSDFKQPPDLDSVSFPLPSRLPWRRGDLSLIPMYRAIRRMAVQGADYEREQMAFKGELRSRRRTMDKCWHPSLWLGILYDGVADCGRSIIQPFAVWAATIIAFAAFYWSRAIAGAETRCAEGDGTFVQALYLSVKNALVLFAGTRDARVNQAYACLYDGAEERLHIPALVTFAETLLQFPVSAALIFLCLLAVKNRFKIK